MSIVLKKLLLYSKAHRRQEISTAVDIGMIDGTHIAIRAPVKNPEVYVCRKKFHSLNVQVSSVPLRETIVAN